MSQCLSFLKSVDFGLKCDMFSLDPYMNSTVKERSYCHFETWLRVCDRSHQRWTTAFPVEKKRTRHRLRKCFITQPWMQHLKFTGMAALEMSERQTVTCVTGMCARAFKTSSTSCGDSRNTQSHNYQSPGTQQHRTRCQKTNITLYTQYSIGRPRISRLNSHDQLRWDNEGFRLTRDQCIKKEVKTNTLAWQNQTDSRAL